jgi:hypothetical protein
VARETRKQDPKRKEVRTQETRGTYTRQERIEIGQTSRKEGKVNAKKLKANRINANTANAKYPDALPRL